MAGIQTAIRLNDQMSAQLNNIMSAINRTITSCNNLDAASTRALGGSANAAGQTVANVNNLVVCTNQAADSQRQYNEAVSKGSDAIGGLVGKVKTLVGAYLGIQTAKGIIETSDALVSTTARLNNMNSSFDAVGKSSLSTAETTNAIYEAAQRSRGEFSNLAAVVAKFGNNAGDAFSGTEEVIAFSELVQKQMAIAGASGTEASNAMLQLSQALGSGVLRGDELRSIFEQAPNLIQSIATYLDVPIGQIRTLAEEGKLTADIVKNSLLSQASEINAQYAKMPITWGQAWTKFKNSALMAFQPVLDRINEIANSEAFQQGITVATNLVQEFASITLQAFDAINSAIDWCKSNWDTIGPIVYSVAAAVAVYTTAVTVATTATAVWNLVSSGMFIWIAGISAAIYAVYELASYIASMSDTASTAFGVVCGWVSVTIGFFKNLGLMAGNIAMGIASAFGALSNNMMAAFHNAISSIKGWFYGLLSSACDVIAGICEALNQLPFVSFDYSGIQGKASEYAAEQAAAQGDKWEYNDIGAAFDAGMQTFEIDPDWQQKAWEAGTAWGDGVSNKVSSAIDGLFSGGGGTTDYAALLEGINASAADTAGNTGKSAKALTATTEDLKYLRDIAERDVINRFTTASVNVDLGGIVNNVSSNTDLDGMVTYIADSLREALYTTAEGVHV